MTRTINDPTYERTSPPRETFRARQGDVDPLHHPPKPATMGLGPDNEPAMHTDGHPAGDQRSIADLIKELRDEAGHLIRQEINLAKTEVSEKAGFFGAQAGRVGAGGAILAIGGLMLLGALGYFTAWLYQGLFEELGLLGALGLGFLTVGAIVAIIGYAMYRSAMGRMRREPLVPERTIHSLKEDKQWLTHKTTEAAR